MYILLDAASIASTGKHGTLAAIPPVETVELAVGHGPVLSVRGPSVTVNHLLRNILY